MEPINYFKDLPAEMHCNILSKLSHAALQQAAFVNKYFFEIATANELWQVHFSIQFPDSVKLIDKNNYYKEFSKRITRRKFDCEPIFFPALRKFLLLIEENNIKGIQLEKNALLEDPNCRMSGLLQREVDDKYNLFSVINRQNNQELTDYFFNYMITVKDSVPHSQRKSYSNLDWTCIFCPKQFIETMGFNLNLTELLNYIKLSVKTGATESLKYLLKNEKIVHEINFNEMEDISKIDYAYKLDVIVAIAVKNGHLAEAKLLLPLVNKPFLHYLKFASGRGHCEIIQYLLKANKSQLISSEDLERYTLSAIEEAFKNGRRKALEILWKYASSSNKKDIFRILPYFRSSEAIYECIIFLLENGADANIITKDVYHNLPILLFAVLFNKLQIVPIYLAHGANINFESIKGETALSIAIKQRQVAMVRLLLENNAHITPTCIAEAKRANNPEIDALLQPQMQDGLP